MYGFLGPRAGVRRSYARCAEDSRFWEVTSSRFIEKSQAEHRLFPLRFNRVKHPFSKTEFEMGHPAAPRGSLHIAGLTGAALGASSSSSTCRHCSRSTNSFDGRLPRLIPAVRRPSPAAVFRGFPSVSIFAEASKRWRRLQVCHPQVFKRSFMHFLNLEGVMLTHGSLR